MALRQTLETYFGYGAVLSAPTTLVGAIGRVDAKNSAKDSAGGRPISEITLVGIDLVDGSAKWVREVGSVTQCSDRLDDGVITCWSSTRVVFVDTGTGDLMSDTSPDFEVGRSEVVDGKAYVSGIQRNGTGRSIVLTGGTPTTPTSGFEHAIDITGPISSVDRVLPSENRFVVSTQTGGSPIYRSTVYDLDSAAPAFTVSNDVLNAVGDGLFLITRGADAGSVGTQQLLDRDGSPLVGSARVPVR